jgi:hypothetical protein
MLKLMSTPHRASTGKRKREKKRKGKEKKGKWLLRLLSLSFSFPLLSSPSPFPIRSGSGVTMANTAGALCLLVMSSRESWRSGWGRGQCGHWFLSCSGYRQRNDGFGEGCCRAVACFFRHSCTCPSLSDEIVKHSQTHQIPFPLNQGK